jgi:putative oxidoreductase
MKNIATIGRILFALPFGIIGLNHFLMTDTILGMMSSFPPGGGFTILLIGALLIAASVCIIMNKFIRVVCFSLAGLLLLFIITIHIPHLLSAKPGDYEDGLFGLLKDTALMGGALIIAAYDKPEENTKTL